MMIKANDIAPEKHMTENDNDDDSAASDLPWSLETTSRNVRNSHYAVRGKLAILADAISAELAAGQKRDFTEIIYCNIGNPQQLNQPSISYLRRLVALVECPELMEHCDKFAFPRDTVLRAADLTAEIKSSGAYTNSMGIASVRRNVARFIVKRDGLCDADVALPSSSDILLTTGASSGIQMVLSCLIDGPASAVMVPVPQYPLYAATVALLGGKVVPYYLDETNEWSAPSRAVLEAAVATSEALVRAICVINPGNPTGSVMSVESMKEILLMARANNLVVLADEVYQENVYDAERPWRSFYGVLMSQPALAREIQLVSFHSTSKGVLGECGRRGGYMHLHNIPADVRGELYKLASLCLCPPVSGQIAVDVLTAPPRPGDDSYDCYAAETGAVFEGLRVRSQQLVKALNQMKGVTCVAPAGAMYLFPRIRLPAEAIDAARAKGIEPDELYCLELLDSTGICVVPGSGFMQEQGTYHFRITFLPSEQVMEGVIRRLSNFHKKFMEKYS